MARLNANGLTDFQRRFADEYLKDQRGGPAYRRAGGTAKDPYASASNLLRNVKIRAYIQQRQEKIAERLEINAENVLKRWWDIATADPNELVQYRRRACRYCYGDKHRYQWIDDEEWQEACRLAEANERPAPSNAGGYGFERGADPHPDCPKCDGEGEASVYVADTRKLSPQARALYAGLKQSQQGLEVKTQDQARALENIAKHLRLLDPKLNLDVPDDSPLAALVQAINGTRGNTLGPGGDDE